MIELNLLPEVKIEFLKARVQKRLVITISSIACAVSLAIAGILFGYVYVVQSKTSNDLSNDIQSSSSELSGTKDLNKILTVQNQLMSIDSLHDLKPAVNRLASFIAKTTPIDIKINQFSVDFMADNSATVTGKALSLDRVNAYVDTLKLMQFKTDKETKSKNAFSSVVLSSFSRDTNGANFTVTFVFNEEMFDTEVEPVLSIKGINGEDTPVKDNDKAFEGGGDQ